MTDNRKKANMQVYLGSQCQQVRQSDLKCFSVSKRQGQNSAKDQSSERYKRQKDQKRKRSDHGLSMICASQRPVSAQISFKQEISFSDQMRARCNYSISTSLYAMSRRKIFTLLLLLWAAAAACQNDFSKRLELASSLAKSIWHYLFALHFGPMQ